MGHSNIDFFNLRLEEKREREREKERHLTAFFNSPTHRAALHLKRNKLQSGDTNEAVKTKTVDGGVEKRLRSDVS